MLAWLKGLWASKGSGGCITADGKGPATLTPLEPKLSIRSFQEGKQEGVAGQHPMRLPAYDGTGSCLQLLPEHSAACQTCKVPHMGMVSCKHIQILQDIAG
jgi:hypothetical protein